MTQQTPHATAQPDAAPGAETLYLIEALARHMDDRTHLVGALWGPEGQDIAALAGRFMADFDVARSLQAIEDADELDRGGPEQGAALDEFLSLRGRARRGEELTEVEQTRLAELTRVADQQYDRRQKARLEAKRALALRLAEIDGLRGYLTMPSCTNDDLDRAFVAWLRTQGFRDAPATRVALSIGIDQGEGAGRGQERFIVEARTPESDADDPLLGDLLEEQRLSAEREAARQAAEAQEGAEP